MSGLDVRPGLILGKLALKVFRKVTNGFEVIFQSADFALQAHLNLRILSSELHGHSRGTLSSLKSNGIVRFRDLSFGGYVQRMGGVDASSIGKRKLWVLDIPPEPDEAPVFNFLRKTVTDVSALQIVEIRLV